MIKKTITRNGVKVTFVLDGEGQPVSVVGDFNGWDPYAHPLRKRSNGMRSAAVELPSGQAIRFRYLDGSGRFFDDADATIEPNGMGETHSLLHV
jgi:1,4-alpha-glucan branching enzyme